MILDKHWWYTVDNELVSDGDERAAVLAYPTGMEIPDATARALGILPPEPEPEPETEPDEEKAKPAPANKARRSAANKEA